MCSLSKRQNLKQIIEEILTFPFGKAQIDKNHFSLHSSIKQLMHQRNITITSSEVASVYIRGLMENFVRRKSYPAQQRAMHSCYTQI